MKKMIHNDIPEYTWKTVNNSEMLAQGCIVRISQEFCDIFEDHWDSRTYTDPRDWGELVIFSIATYCDRTFLSLKTDDGRAKALRIYRNGFYCSFRGENTGVPVLEIRIEERNIPQLFSSVEILSVSLHRKEE
jgi:hypothetical protein